MVRALRVPKVVQVQLLEQAFLYRQPAAVEAAVATAAKPVELADQVAAQVALITDPV